MSDLAQEERLTRIIKGTARDPLQYARIAFPWGAGDLAGSTGPRTWQGEIMGDIRDHLSNPSTRFTPLLIAVASGHGIGKSCEVSMIIDWAVSTCADCRVLTTANTEVQLRTKTWPEVAKWSRMMINKHWFKPTATALTSTDPEHERTWRADAIPWSENNTEAFAGMHNQGKRILIIFDEASAIADVIWEVVEGALTDSDTEIIWLAFGNPTRNTGRFRDCFGKFKHRWKTRQIDSRTVEGTNKVQIQKWIEDYGEDSDFVRVRVRGVFPRAGNMQFIAGNLVEDARTREAVAHVMDPLVMGVDVARFGDDESVIVLRRGRDARTIPWIKLRGVDTMTLAAKVAELSEQYKPDAIFVDEGGVGGGVVDRLRQLRFSVIGVQFGSSADKSVATSDGTIVYLNKRAEMWGGLRDWLKGGAIPNEQVLEDQLVGLEYGYTLLKGKDAIQLEKKKDMKKRLGYSPDMADALALTFAYPVQPSNHSDQFGKNKGGAHQVDYDPLSREACGASAHKIEYNPLDRR